MQIERRKIKGQVKKDSIDLLIKNLKNEAETELIFEGDFETFGYYHPVRFKEGNLYSYYPQNEKAKYKRLEKFNFCFAEFETEDRRKGWLDTEGREYFRE